MNALEHAPSVAAAESIILAELLSASLSPTELKKCVRAKVKALKDKEFKALVEALVEAQRIHALYKLGRSGKPSKMIEAYALGAPPPPPPSPRELAPDEILTLLHRGPLSPADLKAQLGRNVPGLAAADLKSILAELFETERIHARMNGRKIDTYAFGAPPPPAPPPTPPRELAPDEILALLHRGPLSPADLRAQLGRNVPGLAAADLKSILAELVKGKRIYARFGRNAAGKRTRTVDRYSLGGPPADEFIAPLLAKWNEVRSEAAAAGVSDEALITALLQGLAQLGVNIGQVDPSVPTAEDRTDVLQGVRELVAREGHGALIPIRKLRGALRLPKARFDTAVLELYGQDTLILHHHDYVGNLSDAERDELVLDRHGNYYVGVALRGEA